MAHVYLSDKGGECFHLAGRHGVYAVSVKLGHYRGENLSDGVGAKCSFTEDIFMPWYGMEFYHTHPGTLLATVVLLLHQQIELVERPCVGAIFFPVIFQGLAQAYHSHAALVLELFHRRFRLSLLL